MEQPANPNVRKILDTTEAMNTAEEGSEVIQRWLGQV